MTSNKPPSLQLQRRTGLRRPSIPTSPTSPGPVFQRRTGRSAELYSPPDTFLPSSNVESPSLQLDIPSPTFDIADISPALASDDSFVKQNASPVTRASHDFGKQRPKLNTELPRPSTSSAVQGISPFRTSRPAVFSDGSAEAVQAPWRWRDDGHRRADSSDEGPGPAVSNVGSPSIGVDRGLADDGNAGRMQNKKSKLNFSNLNPMSLIARRRSSQNTSKLDDPSYNVPKLQVPAMKDFDPSIRGSFVHDFSAPRTRRPNNDNSPRSGPSPSPHYPRRPSEHLLPTPSTPNSFAPLSTHSAMFKEHFQDDRQALQPTNTAYLHASNLLAPDADSLPTFARRLPLQIPDDHSAIQPPFAGPDSASEPVLHEPSLPLEPQLPPPPPPPAPKRTPSPKNETPPPAAALPKHMASTSSRFSYFGQQGSIDEEKLLEEKHKEHASKFPPNPRQSIAASETDDYDFDDDGLEEPIPGVNTDYDYGAAFDNDAIAIRNIDLPSSMQRPIYQSLASFDDFDDFDDGGFDDGEIEIRNIDIPTSQLRDQAAPQAQSKDSEYHATAGDFVRSKANELQAPPQTENFAHHLSLSDNALHGFHFTPQSLTFSPTSTQHASEPTPRDAQGFAIGLAESDEPANARSGVHIRDSADQSLENFMCQGLGISTQAASVDEISAFESSKHPFDDSELYFDDGEFDNEFGTDGERFDESLLDEANEHIKDIPAENARKYEEARQLAGGNHDQVKLVQGQYELSDAFDAMKLVNKRSSVTQQVNLTEHNLAAYHDALAMAATKAAASGKFDRTVSFSQMSDDDTDSPFHQQAVSQSRGSRLSNNYNLESSGVSDDDAFPFDSDDMDDDAMIAAANAEALENDDDGFYGSEFGFYARAYGKNPEDMINGGFFTARGSNGVKRSHSGKANFQEPSLTPITERTEWSPRNSVASLPLHAGMPASAHSHSSPGLAHLLQQDSPIAEDEMTLHALMRLRGRAFGGSSSSISSLADKHAGSSPLSHVSGYKFPPLNTDAGYTARMSSPIPALLSAGSAPTRSIAESAAEDDEYERPFLTQHTPSHKPSEPTLHSISTSVLSSGTNESLPSSPLVRKQGSNHSRNSSGAESVSYAKEKDGRWVLERRRTGDDGEQEIIEREYLAGTRI